MLVFGLIAIVLSLVQAVLMLFRQAALIVLAGVLPLAAAGSIAPLTRPWVRKVSAWMLALICYKPAAAAVYATAFTMIGSGGSPQTMVMGFVMLLLSVLTLPALMKFFTWTTGTIGGSGGGGQLLGAATMGAIAVGAMRGSGGGSAQDQAAYLDSRLGPPPGGGRGARPPAARRPVRVGPADQGQHPAQRAVLQPSRQAGPRHGPSPVHPTRLGPAPPPAPPTQPPQVPRQRTRLRHPPARRPLAVPQEQLRRTGPITAAAAGAQLAAETTRLANGAMNEGEPAMTTDHPVRTYGGWRRSRSIGLLGLGPAATFILLGCFAALIVLAAFSLRLLLYVAPPAVLAGATGVIRVGGVPLAQLAVQRLRWWHGTRAGHTATAPKSCSSTPASSNCPAPWPRPSCCRPKTARAAATAWSVTGTPAT